MKYKKDTKRSFFLNLKGGTKSHRPSIHRTRKQCSPLPESHVFQGDKNRFASENGKDLYVFIQKCIQYRSDSTATPRAEQQGVRVRVIFILASLTGVGSCSQVVNQTYKGSFKPLKQSVILNTTYVPLVGFFIIPSLTSAWL